MAVTRTTYAGEALWVVPVAELGGVARHVLDVATHGIPRHRLSVLCPEGPLAQRLRAVGARVTTGPIGPTAGLVRSVRTLRHTVLAQRPAVVHSHLAYADIVLAATPLPGQVRRFTTEHGIAGDDGLYHRSRLHSVLMARAHRLRLRGFDGAIAVSEATRRAMVDRWHATSHIEVIRNGVDVPNGRRVRGGAGAGPRVLSLSRLAPEKRIDRLVEAFALLRADRPGARLTIGGEGPLHDALRALSVRLGVGDAVSMPGFLDPELAMRDADVLVQLSMWENCSYALLDAAAAGLGVVAADVGGNPEILTAESLVDPNDTVSVADAIVRAVSLDPGLPDWTVSAMCHAIADAYERSRR
ncbi:glycosyltransferase family 4 protein [Intrasporangium mesophilum]